MLPRPEALLFDRWIEAQLGGPRRVRTVVLLPDLERTLQACRRAGKITASFLNTG